MPNAAKIETGIKSRDPNIPVKITEGCKPEIITNEENHEKINFSVEVILLFIIVKTTKTIYAPARNSMNIE